MLLKVAGILMFIGHIWLVIRAFSVSILWAAGCFFIPFVSLLFAIFNWDDAQGPLTLIIIGVILGFFGAPTTI